MNSVYLVLFVSIVTATNVCDPDVDFDTSYSGSSDTYFLVVSAARNLVDWDQDGTRENFYDYFADQTAGPFLENAFQTPPSAGTCAACIVDFALNVFTQITEDSVYATICAEEDFSNTLFNEQVCLWTIHRAIEELNACADNGLDIRTGMTSTRCSPDEFSVFTKKHTPLFAIAHCAFDQSNDSALKLANCAGIKEDYLEMGCTSCMNTLMLDIYEGLWEDDSPICDPDDFYVNDCLAEILTVANDEFAACSGGLNFQVRVEAHCTDEEIAYFAIMKPYSIAVKCGQFASGCRQDIHGRCGKPMASFCFRMHNSLSDLLGYDCFIHLFYLVVDSYVYNDYLDCEDEFSDVCVEAMRAAFEGPVTQFESLAGFALDTNPTACTGTIDDSHKSHIPLIRCGLISETVDRVIACVENDPLYGDFVAETSCGSCYTQLAIETFLANQNDESGLVAVACSDYFSSACVLALRNGLAAFNLCAGFDSKVLSDTDCSATSSADLKQALSVVTASRTITEALYLYEKLFADSTLCSSCYVDLIRALFELEESQAQNACISDLDSWDCYMQLGPRLDRFRKCTLGWETDQVADPVPFLGGLPPV